LISQSASTLHYIVPYTVCNLKTSKHKDVKTIVSLIVRGRGGARGVLFLGGRKGRYFRKILGERVGGTHFLAREREEMV
jgi:hypothetical protein